MAQIEVVDVPTFQCSTEPPTWCLFFIWQHRMYRQSQQEKQRLNMAEAGGNQIQFLNRMGSLPLVTTAIGQLGSLYNHTKDTNRLMRYTFETAELTVKAVAGTAMPVISKTLPSRSSDCSIFFKGNLL